MDYVLGGALDVKRSRGQLHFDARNQVVTQDDPSRAVEEFDGGGWFRLQGMHPLASNNDKIQLLVSELGAQNKRIVKLEEDNGKLMKMIEAMWYAPNMPGAPEAPDHPSFKK